MYAFNPFITQSQFTRLLVLLRIVPRLLSLRSRMGMVMLSART
jgi:hypothetical protein